MSEQHYSTTLMMVCNLIDNSKTVYEKTLLEKCMRLLVKAKKAACRASVEDK